MNYNIFRLAFFIASVLFASPTANASEESTPVQKAPKTNLDQEDLTKTMTPKQQALKRYNEACSFCYETYGKNQQIQLGDGWRMWWRLIMVRDSYNSRGISTFLAGRIMTCDQIHDYIEGQKQRQILKEFAGNIFTGPAPGVVFVNLENYHAITIGLHKNPKDGGVPFTELNIYTGPDIQMMQAVLAGARKFQ